MTQLLESQLLPQWLEIWLCLSHSSNFILLVGIVLRLFSLYTEFALHYNGVNMPSSHIQNTHSLTSTTKFLMYLSVSTSGGAFKVFMKDSANTLHVMHLLASGSEPTLVSNWEHFSVSIYICDDPRSRKYGHVIRVSKIREWKMFRIVQYTC